MATVTPNFNWPVPTSTDLVKDGAVAIEALGDSIDASLVDLKGGTSGQVLAKASNTDMDFAWVAQDDSNAIQNSIVDAKGDLIAATANDTPARLAVGNNGETLVADSSTSTGLRYQANFAAGKNKIINGDFGIWQRGTSFTVSGAVTSYTADRWAVDGDRTSMGASQQTFTPGTAPVAGYEGQYFSRFSPGTSGSFCNYQQRIEDVRTFAGQTVTLSYWAKCSTGTITNEPFIIQRFGSGGSGDVATALATSTITTTWTRFSQTFTVPSISGKTVGTSSALSILALRFTAGTTTTVDIWGVQVEAGSVATAFQTATGTLQGELAVCQRYYIRQTGTQPNALYALSLAFSTTGSVVNYQVPVSMRIYPTAIEYSALRLTDNVGAYNVTNLTLNSDGGTANTVTLTATVASGLTQFRGFFLTGSNTNNFIGLSAEL